MRQIAVWIACGVMVAACGSKPEVEVPAEDAGVKADSGVSSEEEDAGETDAGQTDAGQRDAGEEVDSGVPPSSPVRINEIYVDRDLSGDRVEFVELAGPVGEPLGELSLRVLSPDGGVRHEVQVTQMDAAIGDTGTWVVGGTLASGHVDEAYSIANWGLDNTKGAVQLIKAGTPPELLDVVGYGGVIPDAAEAPVSTAEGTPVTLPSAVDTSIGRRAGVVDTDDNTADFCIQTSSAGEANGACL